MHILYSVAQGFLSRMRAVNAQSQTVFLESDRRTRTLYDLATHRTQQRLDPAPFDIAVHWYGEDRFERLAMLALHKRNDIK